MKKRVLTLIGGVDNIELFYDLIFVYCISVITGVCHDHPGDFLDLSTYLGYLLPLLIVLQIWFYTTLLLNRYGSKSASDYVCLFVNMFLLYYLASTIGGKTQSDYSTFNVAWALILVNFIVHWSLKRFLYSNIDDDDRRIIDRSIIVLALQLSLVCTALLVRGDLGRYIAIGALLLGMSAWTRGGPFARKPSRFDHVAERCALLIIVTFGETVVAVATYVQVGTSLFFPALVFVLVVGMFLIYIYEYDNMLDHQSKVSGMGYMTINAWIVVVVSNLTVALEFMPDPEVAHLPKNLFLTAGLVLYLLTSLVITRYNKPRYRISSRFVVGRLIACAIVVIAGLATDFDPRVTLVMDVFAMYWALAHEWYLFHIRNRIAGEQRDAG